MSALRLSPEELDALARLVEASLPTNALAERVALSSVVVAAIQARAESDALQKWKADAERFERSLASLVLERETPKPQPASPPRLSVVREP